MAAGTGKKQRLEAVERAAKRPAGSRNDRDKEQAQVSGRWLLAAGAIALAGAVVCTWGALCLLFWQGSWQLLYHPEAKVLRTPANAGVAFDPVAFAATEEGGPRLTGWWIAAEPGTAYGRYTVLYLHGQNGNIGDTVDALARLHAAGVNVLAFDYRGYGQSQFARPNEAHWREDAEWALGYLSDTRHIDRGAIVLDGAGLGANLALEMAAAHPELAGVVVERPIAAPMDVIFNDARARLVPARLLVRDRYDLQAAAAKVRVPVLWFETPRADANEPAAYVKVVARKTLVWLNPQFNAEKDFGDALTRWLDELPRK